jgi:hypothetical protein
VPVSAGIAGLLPTLNHESAGYLSTPALWDTEDRGGSHEGMAPRSQRDSMAAVDNSEQAQSRRPRHL